MLDGDGADPRDGGVKALQLTGLFHPGLDVVLVEEGSEGDFCSVCVGGEISKILEYFLEIVGHVDELLGGGFEVGD